MTTTTTRPKGIRPKRGKIQIRYQHGDQRHYDMLDLSWTPGNIEEAGRIREERLLRLKTGLVPSEEQQQPITPALTFAECAQLYLYLDHALSSVAEDDPFRLKLSSRNSSRDLLNSYWLNALGQLPIERITLDQIKLAVRGVQWRSLKRKKNAYSAVRQVFAFAIDEERAYISTNPAAALTTATKRRGPHKKSNPKPYTPEDRDALLSWLKGNVPVAVYTYFLVAFYSGMRTGELLALTWADYDGESFNVDKAGVRSQLTTTKTDETRRVLMPAWVCAVVNALPSRFKQAELFLNQYGKPYLSGYHLNRYFERAHEATGVRRSKQPNYPWRHTYASIGVSEGAKPAFLAKQLGHTLAVFYSTYAAWIDSDADRHTLELAFA